MVLIIALLSLFLALPAYAQQLNPGGGIVISGGPINAVFPPGAVSITGNSGNGADQINNVSVNGVVNVKAYGAMGDGSKDDTAAIQAAHDAAGNTHCVYFPAGKYLVTSDLNWTSSTNTFCVVGDDPSSTAIQCNFAHPLPTTGGNCFDASGADGYSISNIHLVGGTSAANAPNTTLLLARTGGQGYGHTLTNVWVANYGPYSIYDYGAEVGNWINVRSQPGAVVISSCNHAAVTSKFQTLVSANPTPTSMSIINIIGGQYWAGGGGGNRCGIIFDASCALQSPPPSSGPLHIWSEIHDINIYSAFFGEESNGVSASAPTAGLCDAPGSDNTVLGQIGVYGVRMEAGDNGAHYSFADFSGSTTYLSGFNFYQDTLATLALSDAPVLKAAGCIDSSHIDVVKTGNVLTAGVHAIETPCGRNNDFVTVTHAMVPPALFAGLSGLGDTANRFSWFDGNEGHYDAGGYEANAIGTALTGTTAGSVNWAEPAHGLAMHMVTLNFMGYQNNSATAQTITYPIPFDNVPTYFGGCPSGLSADGVHVALPTAMATAFTGQCIIAGQ